MNWNALDLNLLRVLDAMLADANTTRAGQRIGLSQPAVSAGLGRLRIALGDPLFVREGNRLVTTRYAEGLRGSLRNALGALEQTLGNARAFRPDQSTMTFRVLGDDYLSDILLGGLSGVLAVEAPKMRLEMLPIGPTRIASQLADKSIDIAFDQSDRPMPEWVDGVVALHAQPVVVAARGHRGLRSAGCEPLGSLPLDVFCAMSHACFSPGGDFVPLEDTILATMGRRRHVAMTLPSFLSIAHLVARSELVGTIPISMAKSLAARLGMKLNSPVSAQTVPLSFFWHARSTHDTAHVWMREKMIQVINSVNAG